MPSKKYKQALRRKKSSPQPGTPSGAQHHVSFFSPSPASGQVLPETARSFFEPKFGKDFSAVRVHHGEEAARSAQSIDARAYTTGTDIVFNEGEYAPDTPAGKKLLAHELAHVVQNKTAGDSTIRRQQLPAEVNCSEDVSTLSEEELLARRQSIKNALLFFNESNPEYQSLVLELERIEAQLNIIRGKTFSPESINKFRKYHEQNAKKDAEDKPNDSCIVALNKGISVLTGKSAKELGTTPQTIEKSMKGLGGAGFIESSTEINFETKQGKLTSGAAFPYKLHESLWDAVLTLSKNDIGWIVFGMSIMDGNHSVTLTLDNNSPSVPHIYWSDQWGSKKGWKEYDRTGLDHEVTRLVQAWWNEQAEGKKFNTVIRLWRIKPVN